MVVALVTIAVLASVTAIASSQARQAASVVDNRRSQATARAMAESGVLAARAHGLARRHIQGQAPRLRLHAAKLLSQLLGQ